MTDAGTVIAQLEAEGFGHVFVWRDAPGAAYPPHTHPGLSAHVVLEGEITIATDGESRTFGPGARFDVPPGQLHSGRAGPTGCVYVVGE